MPLQVLSRVGRLRGTPLWGGGISRMLLLVVIAPSLLVLLAALLISIACIRLLRV
jgi:hypothetical protein